MLGLLWYVQRRVGKRMTQRRDEAEVTVVSRRSLGAKAQLVIVETDDRRYVLGVTEHGVNLLDSLPAGHVTHPVLHSTPASAAEIVPAGSDAVARDADAAGQTTPSSRGEFERLLAAEAAASASQPSLRRHRRTRRPDPLRGSILSPETWRQTAEFLRRTR